MPRAKSNSKSKKIKDEYGDDFESEEEPETLIAKPMSKSKTGAKRPSRRVNRRAGSPARQRTQSAPGSKSARELWLNAVNNRNTASLVRGRPPESPRRKTPAEYWIDTLRKSRSGISTESTGMNTFSGLKKADAKSMPYLSTPSYLRVMAGTEKPRKNGDYDPTNRAAPGTPAYKSAEEYYDEVIQLKKQIVNLNQEVSTARAKLRRTEEDNIKKGKDIEQLLDPTKSEDIRRTLGDRKPESGAVIHSLRQKILKLESQLRDKESSYAKLQSDMKMTKSEEMKTQIDVLYQEIVRLHNTKDVNFNKTNKPGKENNGKVKALNETVIRLNDSNKRLTTENKALKEDLQKAIDDAPPPKSVRHREYEDMNKKELLGAIARLEKRAEKAEQSADLADGDTISLLSLDSRRSERPASGKVVLEGSLEEKLTQLDHRETELMEENQKLKSVIKRLREELATYRKKGDKHGSPSPRRDTDERGSVSARSKRTAASPRDRITTPRGDRAPSPSSRKASLRPESDSSRRGRSGEKGEEDDRGRKVSRFREDHAAKSIQRQWRAHRKEKDLEEEEKEFEWRMRNFLENRSAKVIQREWRDHHQKELHRYRNAEMPDSSHFIKGANPDRVQNFTENRAAKRIQQQWHGYQHRKQDANREDATVTIQAALRGHSARRKQIRDLELYDDDRTSTITDDSYDDAVNMIGSSLRGHAARKDRLRNIRYDSSDEDDEDVYPSSSSTRRGTSAPVRRPQSAKSSSSYGSSKHGRNQGKTNIFSSRKAAAYDDEDDDDIVFG